MFKLKYFWFILLIVTSNSINGDNVDISDVDSMNVEDNEIKDYNTTAGESAFEDNDRDKRDSNETIEQESSENKAEKYMKKINVTDRTSLEDENEIKEKLNNNIDDYEPVTKRAYCNHTMKKNLKQVKIVKKIETDHFSSSETENVERNQSMYIMEDRPVKYYEEPKRNYDFPRRIKNDTSEQTTADDSQARRMLFKNCKDRQNDDLCRNTLIDYPYVVSIQKMGSHYATGALLDKRWVLTVAGDFYNIRESIKFFRARLGSVNCKRGGVLLPLQEVSIHPLYVPGKPAYDLGLLRMGEPVDYSDYIKPIRLSVATENVLSAKFLTTYWPRLIVKGELLPPDARERTKSTSLRVSTQQLIGWKYCQKMMLEMNEHLEDVNLCLKPLVTHHSLCLPDPGAPIVADDGLWGITSGWTSKLCYVLPGPTIFTRISAPLVRSWLDAQLLGM